MFISHVVYIASLVSEVVGAVLGVEGRRAAAVWNNADQVESRKTSLERVP